jgi:hypothetical protein
MKEAGLPGSAGVALTLPLVAAEDFFMVVDLARETAKSGHAPRIGPIRRQMMIPYGLSAAPLSTLVPVALVTSYSGKGIAAVVFERSRRPGAGLALA